MLFRSIPNLQYGVLLKKVRVLDMSASTWPHVFRIPHIPPLPKLHHYDVCSNIPKQLLLYAAHRTWNDEQKLKQVLLPYEQRLDRFCERYRHLEGRYNTLMLQMVKEIKRQYVTMKRLILPNKPTVPRTPREACSNETVNIRSMKLDRMCKNDTDSLRNKRGLEFLGRGLGNFFGLASTADLKKLWKAVELVHNNALNFQGKFTKFTDSMMSITNINRKRLQYLNSTMVKALDNLNSLHERMRDFHSNQKLESTYNTLVHHIFIDAMSDRKSVV